MKFIRKCQLAIEVDPVHTTGNDPGQSDGSNNLVIPPQFTIDFEITRQNWGSSQHATFRVYNLGPKTRNRLYKDPYALTEYRAVQFRAGYEDDISLPLCFNGYVSSATSYRVGRDVITEITCYDGGQVMANGFISQTMASGLSVQQILKTLANALPRAAGSPIIGSFTSVSSRGKVLFGNIWNLILQESGNLATIDNGQVKILNYNEAIDAEIPLIDASSGLLGSPKRSATSLDFDMILEPRLTMGQIVQLQSVVNPLFNGTYKVQGFTHRGTISPAVAGDAITSVKLFIGTSELQIIQANVVQ